MSSTAPYVYARAVRYRYLYVQYSTMYVCLSVCDTYVQYITMCVCHSVRYGYQYFQCSTMCVCASVRYRYQYVRYSTMCVYARTVRYDRQYHHVCI